ncbi:hypothetical protein D3Z45_04150 [Lachnospiraceae bacterium]|nr:hypothetical protein [Lachnospiraceae bacterium]
MRKRKEKAVIQIDQGERDKKEEKKLVKVIMKNTFNLVIQLLPVWFMMLLGAVSDIKFEMREYTSNLLIFTVMWSVTNIVDLYGKECLDILADIIKYMLSVILCFSLFFYVLILISNYPVLGIKNIPILCFAIGLCIIVFIAMFCQEIRKVNEKECEH